MLLLILCGFFPINLISAAKYSCDPKLTCGCTAASPTVTSRIVGGEVAANRAWGWMVSLRRDGSHTCGASLVTAQYAITAAHCIKNDINNPSSLTIVVGTNSLADASSATFQRRVVTKIIIHPNYNTNGAVNDIAILQFAALKNTGNSSLGFICLPMTNQDPFRNNADLVAIGWGYTYEGSGSVSNSLRQVTIQTYSSTSTDCVQSGLRNSNAQFCAGNVAGGKGKYSLPYCFHMTLVFYSDTCQGDSGGPLMAFVNNQWVLAGITSIGPGCARAGYVGIYTRVSSYISFITSTVKSGGSITTIDFGNAVQSNSIAIGLDKFVYILVFLFLYMANL